MNILIVEDEKEIREGVSEYLAEVGYSVISAEDGMQAIELFKNNKIDLVILDIMLPKANGFVVLNKIRQESNVPVIMLTAMSDDYTQIMSFDEEADDYITKPFSIIVLHKRIEALLRRGVKVSENKKWCYGDIEIDFEGYSARKNGENIDLKPKEIKLIELLLKYEGKVLTRAQILDNLWRIEEAPNDRVIDVYIKNIRKKLLLDCIVTVKGIGYKFEEQ
ncbi:MULTISPECIES: response regulator transcription factor [Bacillota]|uniref:Stage 0 sporulation protein A homolog n=1 Tax=Clostridium tertium TaxID=1559 RepID=A0A9X3XQ74_9CLOT|nr:response regulator transcription factor [Turicibacter sp. GALT-G1]MBS5308199.1 response regulator transcription factor [Clostridium sp.]MCE9656623.1 response regulator transcription factor [Clostridium celatum]MDC4241242.1 response regulator transcription factor [Clostridium tertium]MBS5886800.1 response regulator transcription factor [Clostridium sp.]MCU7208161.1 response regulator transcription factor [Turicibacter sp. GALT-G1]